MAYPSGFDGTDIDVFRPAIWAEKINEFFRANLVAANHFLDMSGELSGGGDTIYIPDLLEITATAKTNAVAVAPDTTTQTTVTLTIDTWYYAAVMIEKREMSQIKKSYMLQERYAKALAYACAKQLDVAICSLFSAFSNAGGSSSATLADSDIRNAIKSLDANNVPQSDRAFFFHPNEIWGDLMAIDRYTLLDESGHNSMVTGAVATLYGIPVYSTTNIQATSALGRCSALAHKEAIAWGTTYGVATDTNYIPEYLATLITADVVYGVVENRDAAGYLIKSSS
jgi:hypothetical protein